MNIKEYYFKLVDALKEAETKLADPNRTYLDSAKYEIQRKVTIERINRFLKLSSSKMDKDEELKILNETLPKEFSERLNSFVERAQKNSYTNYLTGVGDIKIDPSKVIPFSQLSNKSLDELREMVKEAGGENAVKTLEKKGILTSTPSYAYEKSAPDFIGKYNELISKEDQDLVISETESILSPLDYTPEQATMPKYHDEIAAIKASMTENDFPLKENGERYTREETEALLDFVDSKLYVLKPNIALDEYRKTLESIQETESARRGRSYIEKFPEAQKGIKDNSSDKRFAQWKGPDSQENIEALDALRQFKFSFSEQYKSDMKYMMRRLDEINHVEEGLSGEQQVKAYGFTKLSTTSSMLQKAIQNGNTTEILKLSQEYQKDYNDIKELVEFSDTHFSKDPIIFSGNLDVARNDKLPYEFCSDLRNAAHINSAFTALIFIKNNGVSIDEFIENPIEIMLEKSMPGKVHDLNEYAKQPYKTKTITEMVNGVPTEKQVTVPRTLGEMFRFMHSSKFTSVVTDKAVDYGGNRAIDGLCKACPDVEAQSQNFGAMIASSVIKEAYTNYVSKAMITQDLDAYQNLIVMGDEERDYVKALSGNRAFNPVTKEVESGKVDTFERLGNLQDNCMEFGDRIKTILHDFYVDDTMMSAGTETLLAATQLLVAKYLSIKPDAKNQPGYNELKNLVEDPYREVNKMLKEWSLPPINLNEASAQVQNKISTDIGKKFVTFIDNPKFEKNLKTIEKQLKNDIKAKEKAFATAKRKSTDKESTSKEYISSLKQEFLKGNITEYYYKTRTEQILSGSTAKAPSMFRIDDFPKLKNYVPNLTEEERDGLSKDDIKILYERDKERAQAEKDIFLRRKSLENAGVIIPVERKMADEPAKIMSDTVLIKNETGFESKEIEAFYNELSEKVSMEKNEQVNDFEVVSEEEVLEAKNETNVSKP